MRMNSTEDFINAITLLIEKKKGKTKAGENRREEYLVNNTDRTFRLGKIDPGYSGSGRPSVIFEGESRPSVKKYPYLASYTPTAGDWVLLAQVGNSYIILGERV